ncbi:MAG: hypothetical protein RSA90_04920 [Lachnospiraceae bacterium]
MKEKYRIGFFVATVLCIVGLTGAYELTYRYTQSHEKQKITQSQEYKSVQTKGTATKEEGYYLKNLNGYLVVYIGKSKTVYEYTNIEVKELPDKVQAEIRAGKCFENPEALYSFLENYSS